MDKKMRMIRYISAMTKFRLADCQIVMNMLKAEIDTFTEDSIGIIVKIVQSVG